MQVIAINGSARAEGNTSLILRAVTDEIENAGIACETVSLAGKRIAPCKACLTCRTTRRCAIDDDFEGVFEKLKAADGILLGSPVYSADVSGMMKAFIERAGCVLAADKGSLRYKPCAAVAAVRRGGGLAAVDTMNHFFLNKNALVVGSTYWNMVYGRNIGEALGDEEGMKNMRDLGRSMAEVLLRLSGK